MTLVSVITPAHQAEPFIARAVRSVLAQGLEDWELVVVSDDGVDYRAALARAGVVDPRLRFLDSGRPGAGPGAARNRGLAAARGQYLAPLDADDLFYPQRLERLVALAAASGMAGDNLRVVDDAAGVALGTAWPEGDGLRWLGLREYAVSSVPMTFVFRRELVSWRWEEGLGLGEDTLFNLRGFERLGRVPVAEQVLHEYRVRAGSLCHAPDSAARAELAYTGALEGLARGGLGFRTPQARLLVREMLLARRRLNRAFQASLTAGHCQNFQEFIAAREAAAAA
jgi:glycosyltransferase involved in cell wall biosynthesis